jgi:predicted Zn-dependent peptidase
MKDLEAASINDVRDFFRTYYVLNNATLVSSAISTRRKPRIW